MRFEDYTFDYPKDEPTITDVRYFYKNSLKDIVLRGRRDGDKFTFQFEEFDGKFKEKFVLKKLSTGNFTGTWEQGNKKLTVSLKPIKVSGIENPFKKYAFIENLKENDPFEYVRSSMLVFEKDSVSIYNNKHFQWVSETHCNSFGFFPGEDFDSTVRNTLQAPLEKLLLENTLKQLSCASEFEYNTGNGIEYSITLTYLDQSLIGFKKSSGWFCGGAHPDFGTCGYLFDLSNGKSFDIDEIVAFDSSVVIYDEKLDNFSAYTTYRRDYFAPAIVDLLQSVYNIEMSDDGDEYGCNYSDPQNWEFGNWIYQEDGIVFIPSFARVARACETEQFVIPFSYLKKSKNAYFPYDFPKKN